MQRKYVDIFSAFLAKADSALSAQIRSHYGADWNSEYPFLTCATSGNIVGRASVSGFGVASL